VRQKIIRLVRGDNLCMASVYEGECAAGRADVHRLPQAV